VPGAEDGRRGRAPRTGHHVSHGQAASDLARMRRSWRRRCDDVAPLVRRKLESEIRPLHASTTAPQCWAHASYVRFTSGS
jgi:hypothetical protein